MKKCLWLGLILVSFHAVAQDEGVITKKERFDRAAGVFLGLGPSFTLGKNIGDYSTGFNFEAGYLKRVNRVLSIGPSVSYLSFKYDPEQTGYNNIFIGGPYVDNDGYAYHQGVYFDLDGGDLSLVSLAFNLKLNFIPVKDNSVISLYAFAKPFVSYVSRTEVTGVGTYLENYGDITDANDWIPVYTLPWEAGEDFLGYTPSDDLEKQTEFSGGIFVGPGIEFFPAGKVSGFFQVSIGYTFPVSYISTESYENSENYGNDLDVFLEEIEDYPLNKEGFPSVNLQFGVSFNF